MDASIIEAKNKVEYYKAKLLETKSEEEIQRMADQAIVSIRREIKKKGMPADLAPLFLKVVDLLRIDPVKGLALMDHMADFLSDEIKNMKIQKDENPDGGGK
jgi:hypothetical protein